MRKTWEQVCFSNLFLLNHNDCRVDLERNCDAKPSTAAPPLVMSQKYPPYLHLGLWLHLPARFWLPSNRGCLHPSPLEHVHSPTQQCFLAGGCKQRAQQFYFIYLLILFLFFVGGHYKNCTVVLLGPRTKWRINFLFARSQTAASLVDIKPLDFLRMILLHDAEL